MDENYSKIEAIFLITVITSIIGTPISGFDITKCKILDMSHSLSAETPHYMGMAGPNFTITHKGPIGKDAPYASWGFMCAYEHMSTHIDAPSHFDEHGIPIDKIGSEKMVGEARVIDVTKKALKDPRYGLTVEDILDHEKEHGVLQPNTVLLMSSGWDAKYDDLAAFVGTSDFREWKNFKFPGFAPEVGPWLVKNRKIRAVGVDSLGFDVGVLTSFPNHYALLPKGILGVELLKNVGKLPPKGATIFLPPTKIKGGTGAWTRAFALGWDGLDDPCRIGFNQGAGRLTMSAFVQVLTAVMSIIIEKLLNFDK